MPPLSVPRQAAPQLSVIIPTVNEADHLPGLLEQLRRQRGITLEILLADGQSTDGTPQLAERLGVRTIACPVRGRGAQMNAAAVHASSAHCLFLHADSALPDPDLLHNALVHFQRLQAVAVKPCAGHFRLRFIDPPFDPPWILRYFQHKTALNRPECIHGDQGLLISCAFFRQLGGFRSELPFLEDQHLAGQVAREGIWITLPGTLESSARRFRQEGVIRRILLNAMILMAFHADFREFLAQAPRLYRTQDTSRPLRLLPFFDLLAALDRQTEWRDAWQRWYRLGRFARRSLWQLFFLGDLLITPLRPTGRHPLTALHDRLLQPLLDFTPCDLMFALLLRFGTRLATKRIAQKKSI
ncbi:MAG: TIGR04283 family arsenosugar biosynthesis glycosyltransferase [Magnetococcales bacterium]|nr:TIGR04283 family arsenosugar biosynthesis glycosyltransferase [Magnetococcales bacterium]